MSAKSEIIAALVLCFSPASHAALEFTGYMRLKEVSQFVVTDRDSGATSGWLTIGSVFEGGKVTAFDELQEVLVLDLDGKSIRLPLREAHVRDGKAAPPEKIELTLKISPDGSLMIEDRAVELAAFDALLRKYAASGAPLALYYYSSPVYGAKAQATLEAVMRLVPKSGVKKYSMKVVDSPPPGK